MLLPVDNVHEKTLRQDRQNVSKGCVFHAFAIMLHEDALIFHAELLDEGAQSRGGTRGFISKNLNFVLAKSLRERQLLVTLSSLM